MATEIVLSTLQQGISPDGSRGLKGIFTVTPGTTATAGEAITDELSPFFQSIESITVGGCSAIAVFTGQIPAFEFTAGGLLSANDVTIFWLTTALAIDNGTDLSSAGTFQIEVTGQPA